MNKWKTYIPNILTSSRLILTPLIVYLGLTDHIKILIGVAALVALTDYFDGLLARRWNVVSTFGAKLDAISDKMLVIGLLIILIVQNHSFFFVLILECIIALINLYFYFKSRVAKSLMIGKIKTWVIFLTIIIGLIDLVFPSINIPINYFVYFTVIWQIGSLVSYIKYYIDRKKKQSKLIDEYEEFYQIIKPIIEHPELQKRKDFMHHVNVSVYEHVLRVSFDSYKIAKKLGWDYEASAIGGLLHDFYDRPWQDDKKKTPFLKKHGFVHAEEARINAKKYFPEQLNPRIEDIIKKHMFPLNKKLPRYKESWLISFVDKADSMDFLIHPRALFKIFFLNRLTDQEKETRENLLKKIQARIHKSN